MTPWKMHSKQFSGSGVTFGLPHLSSLVTPTLILLTWKPRDISSLTLTVLEKSPPGPSQCSQSAKRDHDVTTAFIVTCVYMEFGTLTWEAAGGQCYDRVGLAKYDRLKGFLGFTITVRGDGNVYTELRRLILTQLKSAPWI